MGLKVSLDGGDTYVDAPNGVRVIYTDMMIIGEEEGGEIHVNLTQEGIITDLWQHGVCEGPGSSPTDFNVGTSAEPIDDIICRLQITN